MWGARLNYDLLLGCKASAGGAHTRADSSVMNCSAYSSVMKQCCLPPAGHRLPLFFIPVVSNETKLHVTCLHHSSASTLVTAQRTISDMAAAYSRKKQFDRAMELYERAQRINRSILGPSHPQTQQTEANLVQARIDDGWTKGWFH